MAFDFDEMLQTIKDKQWALADVDWDAPGAETMTPALLRGTVDPWLGFRDRLFRRAGSTTSPRVGSIAPRSFTTTWIASGSCAWFERSRGATSWLSMPTA